MPHGEDEFDFGVGVSPTPKAQQDASASSGKRTRVDRSWTPTGGAQQDALAIPWGPNVDVTIDPRGYPGASGAILRLYAVTGAARVLLASTTLADAVSPARVSGGAGADSYVATLQLGAGAPASQPAGDLYVAGVSFSGLNASAGTGTGGGGGAGPGGGALITDADVAVGAAIQGTKTDANFGALTVLAGALTIAGLAAVATLRLTGIGAAGFLRADAGGNVTSDASILDADITGPIAASKLSGNATLGAVSVTSLSSSGTIASTGLATLSGGLRVATLGAGVAHVDASGNVSSSAVLDADISGPISATKLSGNATLGALTLSSLTFAANAGNVTIAHADSATASATGSSVTVRGQNMTGTATTGGALILRGGNGSVAGPVQIWSPAAQLAQLDGAATNWLTFGVGATTGGAGNLRVTVGQPIVTTRFSAGVDTTLLDTTTASGGTVRIGDPARSWYVGVHGYQVGITSGSAGFWVVTGSTATQLYIQNSTAADYLALGALPAGSGTIRMSSGQTIKFASAGVDYSAVAQTGQNLTIGQSNATNVLAVNGYALQLNGQTSVTSYSPFTMFATWGGTDCVRLECAAVATAALRFGVTTTPTIYQADTAAGTGAKLTVRAQNATAASSTGGDLEIGPGSGTLNSGRLSLINMFDYGTPGGGLVKGFRVRINGTDYTLGVYA